MWSSCSRHLFSGFRIIIRCGVVERFFQLVVPTMTSKNYTEPIPAYSYTIQCTSWSYVTQINVDGDSRSHQTSNPSIGHSVTILWQRFKDAYDQKLASCLCFFFVAWTIFHCHRVIQNGSLLSLLVLYSANKHLFYATGEAKCSKQTKLSETMPRFCLISNHPVKSKRQRAQLPHSVMVSLRVVQSSAGGTFCIYRENEPS